MELSFLMAPNVSYWRSLNSFVLGHASSMSLIARRAHHAFQS
jgi:hypothetical protein